MNVKRSEGDTRGDRFKKRNEGIRGRVALHFLNLSFFSGTDFSCNCQLQSPSGAGITLLQSLL